jgi:hypothetical protein
VAIRAEDPEIAQPVVVSPTIDVIQLQRDWLAVPDTAETDLTSLSLEPLLNQPLLESVRVEAPPDDKDLTQRASRHHGSAYPPAPPLTNEVGGIDSHLQQVLLQSGLFRS